MTPAEKTALWDALSLWIDLDEIGRRDDAEAKMKAFRELAGKHAINWEAFPRAARRGMRIGDGNPWPAVKEEMENQLAVPAMRRMMDRATGKGTWSKRRGARRSPRGQG